MAGNATNFREFAREIKTDLQKELESMVAVAEAVLDSLKRLRPNKAEVEFGVELGGEMVIPLVSKGEASANFKIRLKWRGADVP